MAHPSGGRGKLFPTKHTFAQAYDLLGAIGLSFLSTSKEKIVARQSFTKDRAMPIITFVGENSRHGGVCEACWGFPIDCNGSRIGHCVKPLDQNCLDTIGLGDSQIAQNAASQNRATCVVNPVRIPGSRAEIEKEFRDTVLKLESVIREHMPWGHAAPDRRTLGYLIHECEEVKLLQGPELKEAFFVNAVRNSLYHPGIGDVSEEQLARAIQSAAALFLKLENY